MEGRIFIELTIVAQSHKLNIEDPTLVLPDPTNTNRVPTAQLPIEPRLGAVRLIEDLDARARGARTAEGLGLANVVAQGPLDLLGRGHPLAVLEPQRDASRVAVEDGDAVAGGADAQVGLLGDGGGVTVDGAEDLAGLGLELVLLARDERHDVVEHVHAADARVARPRHGLHGDDADGVDGAEAPLQRRERDHEPDHRAVRVAHQEPLCEAADAADAVVLPPLVRDQVQVREVDRRHHEWHERVPPVVLRVREYR